MINNRFFSRFLPLGFVIIIAVFFRFWQLGSVPPSPDWDEAALGWNAYSVLQTGRDEYGTPFPLSLRSFDDYKPPLYMYLTIPFVAAFGLDTHTVRLPAAVVGVLAVVGVFVLAHEFGRIWSAGSGLFGRVFPFVASLLFAMSPWHIQFSRIAFEANIGVAINIWAVALFLRFLRYKRYLWISGVLFGLGLYAYHSERIFLPLLVLFLGVAFWKELRAQKQQVVLFVIAGLLTVLPLIPVFFNSTTLTRLKGTSVLSDQTGLLKRSVAKLAYDQERGDKLGALFDNRRIVWVNTLVSGYLSHFSPKWLFLTGDNARHHAPDMGIVYLWELPFILLGMLWVSRRGGKMALLLWGWFFVAPVAASPTTELPHGIRTLVFLPTFQIFAALGIVETIRRVQQMRTVKTISIWYRYLVFGSIALYAALAAFNIFYYAHMYFVHTNTEYSKYWQFGYKEAVAYATRVKGQYKKIVVSTNLEQPHMFFLFFLKYDPKTYLAEGGTASGGFAEVKNAFDVYEFRPIDWAREKRDGTELYIGTPLEIPDAIDTILYLDGTEAIRIADR
jgi:4-amino-4-deoxy-L-arabinose transferase-like glycosyltransferase